MCKQFDSPSPSNASATPPDTKKSEDQDMLNHVADDAAEQARKTEQRYDQEHSIFTK